MTAITIAFHHERPIDPRAVRELYTHVGWWPQRTPEKIARVLQDALAVGAWDGDQLVGFARAVSDGHFHAYIDDVAVRPDHQRKGLGSLLLTKLLDGLQEVETVTLFCQQSLVPFYEAHGFQAFPSQMVLHRAQPAPRASASDS